MNEHLERLNKCFAEYDKIVYSIIESAKKDECKRRVEETHGHVSTLHGLFCAMLTTITKEQEDEEAPTK